MVIFSLAPLSSFSSLSESLPIFHEMYGPARTHPFLLPRTLLVLSLYYNFCSVEVSPERSTPSTAHRRTSLTTSTAAATSTDGSQWPGRQPHCHVPSDAGSGRSDFSSEDSRSSASVSSSPRHADSHKRKRSRKAASDSAARLGREHKHYRKKKKKKRHYYTSSATSDADSGSSSDSHRHVRKAEKKQRTSLKTKHHKAKKRKHKSGKKHH
eukprot:scpid86631/ scgid0458/ 